MSFTLYLLLIIVSLVGSYFYIKYLSNDIYSTISKIANELGLKLSSGPDSARIPNIIGIYQNREIVISDLYSHEGSSQMRIRLKIAYPVQKSIDIPIDSFLNKNLVIPLKVSDSDELNLEFAKHFYQSQGKLAGNKLLDLTTGLHLWVKDQMFYLVYNDSVMTRASKKRLLQVLPLMAKLADAWDEAWIDIMISKKLAPKDLSLKK